MDLDVRHITLGFNVALCVITFAWNIYWRHYARYAALLFRKSFETPEKRTIRILFGLFLAGSLLSTIKVVVSLRPSIADLGWSIIYGAIIAIIFFAMDAFVHWLRPNGS